MGRRGISRSLAAYSFSLQNRSAGLANRRLLLKEKSEMWARRVACNPIRLRLNGMAERLMIG